MICLRGAVLEYEVIAIELVLRLQVSHQGVDDGAALLIGEVERLLVDVVSADGITRLKKEPSRLDVELVVGQSAYEMQQEMWLVEVEYAVIEYIVEVVS